MKTVVFSDVHGNLPAFEAMLRHAGPADRYVSLGDVVNYGPWADECAVRIAALPNCDRLLGNHEVAFLRGRYEGAHPVARAFFEFCFPRFHCRNLIESYGDRCGVGAFTAQHTLEGRYIYPDTPLTLDRDYLIGHSHHQFNRTMDGHLLCNVGSVGQNRRDLGMCNYVICGPGAREFEMRSCRYEVGPVLGEMRRQGYPAICLDYYLSKIVDIKSSPAGS